MKFRLDIHVTWCPNGVKREPKSSSFPVLGPLILTNIFNPCVVSDILQTLFFLLIDIHHLL
jgi:hypothetical protein